TVTDGVVDLARVGLRDRLNSARPVADGQGRSPQGGMTQNEGISLFAEANFGGLNATFPVDVPDLRRYNMNDRVDSLQITRGEVWEVCENINYAGRCQVFSNDEANLDRISWGGMISSLRRLANEPRGRGRGQGDGLPSQTMRPRLVLFEDI